MNLSPTNINMAKKGNKIEDSIFEYFWGTILKNLAKGLPENNLSDFQSPSGSVSFLGTIE